MSIVLRPEEIRVLGVLIEKSLAQPAYYPMTINAIVAACNQKNNRDPVVNYTESEVSAALSSLRRNQLVSQAEPEQNARSIRFKHETEARYGWNAAQRAIMSELMIRGPQTLGELRTHASRMAHLEAMDYTRELLRELEKRDPPMIVELPREAGKATTRFAQLLGGEVSVPVSSRADAIYEVPPAASNSVQAQLSELAERVSSLENEVSRLRETMKESSQSNES